ncbi:MAG: YjgP/YjgQ family permease [Ignavibacteriaceae bacterium]|nr:YjgP/YjgQ family permease [Ignavibacteriaceae bacterium]
MKILDRYLIKQYLLTIIFGLIAFTLIFVVIDMMENLDDFIDQNVPTFIIFNYYLVFSPEIIKLISPVAVLFAALFTAGKAANLSEITAIKASGVSLLRFMLPFLITTFIISLASIYFSGYVVPHANSIKVNLERKYLNRGFVFTGSNIFFKDSPVKIVNIAFFDNSLNQAHRVSIQEFDISDPTKMISRIDALKMTYDTTAHCWKAQNVAKRFFSSDKESANYYNQLTLFDLNFRPEDLASKQQKPEEMNLKELKKLITSQEREGTDPKSTLIEYYSRFSFSMASMVVVLFGIPLAATKRRRGGLAVQIGINILVTFIYLVFMKVSQAFGKNGALDPLLTAWFANLVFLLAALATLPKLRH